MPVKACDRTVVVLGAMIVVEPYQSISLKVCLDAQFQSSELELKEQFKFRETQIVHPIPILKLGIK